MRRTGESAKTRLTYGQDRRLLSLVLATIGGSMVASVAWSELGTASLYSVVSPSPSGNIEIGPPKHGHR
jgi:hypothetical protein